MFWEEFRTSGIIRSQQKRKYNAVMMQQFAVKKSNGVARARVREQNALGRKTGQKHHGKWEKMGQNQEEEKIGRESEQSGKKG